MTRQQYDVVVWGATGFTGKWVAKHLYDHYPQSELKWAIAGRNTQKLAEVRAFIGDSSATLDALIADSDDLESLQELVSTAKVIISTVGPYAYYGSKLVKACAEAGTHYVDLTGEVPWIRDMIDTHNEAAIKSGAKIVHSCGFDSIPSDMGTYFVQQQAHSKLGEYLTHVRYSLTKAKGGISGGTIASMVNVIKQAVSDKQLRKVLLNPYSLNPDPSFKGPDKPDQSSVTFSDELDKWTTPFVMAGINTRIVRRSNALMGFRYGQEFCYSETMPTARGFAGYTSAKAISSAIKAMLVMGITAPGRKVLGWLLPEQGKGPVVDPDNPGFYDIQFNGETASGVSMIARLTGDADPGYGSTSKILAESAVCLALDELETKGGFWTPSSAMGDALLTRLSENAGLNFSLEK